MIVEDGALPAAQAPWRAERREEAKEAGALKWVNYLKDSVHGAKRLGITRVRARRQQK